MLAEDAACVNPICLLPGHEFRVNPRSLAKTWSEGHVPWSQSTWWVFRGTRRQTHGTHVRPVNLDHNLIF